MSEERISWRFYGYVSPAGTQDVQEWFDTLLEEEGDDAKDVLGYLQKQPRHLWKEPGFEPFDADISEIKFKASTAKKIYRIYGAFWPENQRYSYTFLLAKNKKVNNDQKGKGEAVKRLKRLRRGEAKIHEFEFEKESDSARPKGNAGPLSVC